MAPPSSNAVGSASEAIHSPTSGVKPMSIMGRMERQRERTIGMNNAERAWRRKWLKDQALSPREPLYIWKDDPRLLNPIRKMYRWPLDKLFFGVLKPVIGEYPAKVARFYTGRGLMGLWGVMLLIYEFKYHTNDWTRDRGIKHVWSRPAAYPGDPHYPEADRKKYPRDYHDNGFKDSIFGNKYNNAINAFGPDEPQKYSLEHKPMELPRQGPRSI